MAEDADIRDLARGGNKIQAIKLYRERYGVGLAEAKDAVDLMEAGGAPPTPSSSNSPVDQTAWSAIDEHLLAGSKIQAIKLYRERFGTGLKEAKDAIDQRVAAHPRLQVKSGCFIATAAFGTPLAPEVQVLRRFRDRTLGSSRAGRKFIGWYYRWSPDVADRVRRHHSARALVRLLLRPISWMCRRVSGGQ